MTYILTYSIVGLLVAIISATVMRVKACDGYQLDHAFIGVLLGVVWPLTMVVGVVYLSSDFLYRKINAKKEG